jgi:hypothetical protein
MATKADFTEDEWKALQKGLTGAGLLVSVWDQDFTDSFGEANALAKYMAEAHQASASPLMREIAGTHGTGFGMHASPDRLESETTASLQQAVELLGEKAPDEVDNYRQLVLGAADHVANAKGGGVSEKEQAAIDKIKAALGSGAAA